MTAQTKDKEQVFNDSRIYMPYPGRNCAGAEMGRGPYEKCGLIRDTGLEPNRPVHETFEFTFPYHEVTEDGEFVDRVLDANQVDVNVKVWYVPFGSFNGTEVLWYEEAKTITLPKEWVWKK